MRAKSPLHQAWWPKVLLAIFLASAIPTHAQSVIGLPATIPSKLPNTPHATAKPAPLSDIASAYPKTGTLAQWGPLSVRPHVLYRLYYGDGLLLPGQLEPQSSTIQAITAGSLFELGKYWDLDYSLSRVIYSNPFIRDSTDHSVDFNGGISSDVWTVAVFLAYRASTPLLVQTGRQNKEYTYVAGISGTYSLGQRTLLESGVTWNTRLVNDTEHTGQWTAIDWHSWTISSRADYQFSPRLTSGLGVEITYDDLQIGPDMTSTQPFVKVTWRPLNKVSLSAQAGTERRRIKSSDVKNLSNPVYSASVEYRPVEVTSLFLTASQRVSASYFANQASKNTTWGINLSQRLLERFYLTAGFGQAESTYIATASDFVAGRNDKFTSYYAKLSTTVFSRGTIAIFFNTSRNASNTVEFGFSSHQFGTEIGYKF